MKPARWILGALLVGLAWLGGYGYGRWYGIGKAGAGRASGGRRILYYVDPMHPAYKSDKPGIAPDCNMKLEPVYAPVYEDDPPARAEARRKVLHYRDPRNPQYTSRVPGLSPETGAELEPVYEEEPAGTVRISTEKQQTIGVRFGEAAWTSGTQTIRALGRVTIDERRVSQVHSKLEGWIETVLVDFTGQLVTRGQPLLTLYSPDMLAAQQEFLLAEKAGDQLRHSALADTRHHTDALREAARTRLALWDFSPAEMERLARTRAPVKTYTLHSPASGHVMERRAFPGQRITPESSLYTIVDLTRVWILADVFEQDASRVRLGQAALVRPSYGASGAFTARVSHVLPQVDAATRTLKVRLEAANPGLALKPEMFADVEFRLVRPRMLTVPAEAVLDSGLRKTVFVDRGNGAFEPRQVETGERVDGRVQILRGLAPGERVVTSGNFLIDSESQLKAATSGMSGTP